jgi:hypothetical protein
VFSGYGKGAYRRENAIKQPLGMKKRGVLPRKKQEANMLYDKIIRSLLEIKKAIKEKFGDDGQKTRGRSTYSSGPDGHDRIQYETRRIAEAVRHSTIAGKVNEMAALIPATLPAEDGRYVLVITDGVLSWEPESSG